MAIGTTSNMEWLSGGGSGTSYNAGTGIDITNNTISVKIDGSTITTNASGELVANGVGVSQVQSDWTQTNDQAVDYIKNKPTIPSGNQLLPPATSADENKVLTVDSNGDPEWATSQGGTQVQSDWNQTNNQAVDFIKNKPTIPSGNQLLPPATSADEDKVLTVDSNGDPQWETPSASTQQQADWAQTNSSAVDYIKNKPTIVNPVQSDWNQTNSSALDYIKNKPSVLSQGKDLVAGTNITLQQNSDSVIISAQYAGATYNTQQISGSGHIMVSSTAQISTDLTDSGEIAAYFRCQCDQTSGWPGPSSIVDRSGALFTMNTTIETTDFIDYTGGVFTESHLKHLAQYGTIDTYSGYMYSIDFNSDGLVVPYIGVNSDVMVFELTQEKQSSDRVLKQVGFSTTEAPISLMCDVIGGTRVKLNMYGVSATQTPSRGLYANLCFPCLSIVVRRL